MKQRVFAIEAVLAASLLAAPSELAQTSAWSAGADGGDTTLVRLC